jgi:hypothetical protein
MKIFLKIAITFLLGISMLLGMLFTSTNSDNAEELDQNSVGIDLLSSIATMAGQSSTIGDVPTAADFRRAVYFDVAFFIACLVGIVFGFINKKNAGLIVAGVVGVCALLFYFMQPSFDGIAFQNENSDKAFSLGVAVTALIGAGLLALLKFQFTDPAPTTVA